MKHVKRNKSNSEAQPSKDIGLFKQTLTEGTPMQTRDFQQDTAGVVLIKTSQQGKDDNYPVPRTRTKKPHFDLGDPIPLSYLANKTSTNPDLSPSGRAFKLGCQLLTTDKLKDKMTYLADTRKRLRSFKDKEIDQSLDQSTKADKHDLMDTKQPQRNTFNDMERELHNSTAALESAIAAALGNERGQLPKQATPARSYISILLFSLIITGVIGYGSYLMSD